MLIFGGTTEGRRLARALSAMGHQVWVSVATPLGAEELAGLEDVSVLVGRRSGGEMDALLSRGFHRCVDATHPYAVQATREIGAACARAGVPLRRLLRPEGGEEGLRVDSPEEAARLLAGREGNILLATGAKELPAFAALEPARLFPRVLPSEESVAACRRAGIPSRNIIALYGPFTQRLNEALMEQYHIRFLVTKDGGEAGGFREKAAAALAAGVALRVIRRPGTGARAWRTFWPGSRPIRRKQNGSDADRDGTGRPHHPHRPGGQGSGGGGRPDRGPPSGGGAESGT